MAIITKLPTADEASRFAEWGDKSRETVFELWMFHGRPKIAELVRIVQAETGARVPDQTIRDWFKAGNWDAEADRRLAALAPNMMVRSALSLTLAGMHASRYVEAVWSGREEFDRDRHAAALATLGALGFSPGSKSRPQIAPPADTDQSTDTSDPVDAAARIAERRQRWGR